MLNAINDQMIDEINDAAAELEDDADVWTIIVTGTGRALCAGADVNKAGVEERGNYTSGIDVQGEEILGSIRQWDAPQEATLPYLEMTKPIICAVNGICAGAGLDLVTTSDIVIASDDATFFDPHVSIGVVSGRGGAAARARAAAEHHHAARADGQARAAVGATGVRPRSGQRARARATR